jgi:acyl carrier protein
MKVTPESLIDILADFSGLDANVISMEMPTSDLGLDSLDNVEVIISMEEQFDVELEEANFIQCLTVGDMLKMIQDAQDFSETPRPSSACTDETCESCQ